MVSVQEKNLSQLSREKSEKSRYILTFHKSKVSEVVQTFVDCSVPFTLDYPSKKPDFLRVAFSPDDLPQTFLNYLLFYLSFGFPSE